MSGLNTVPGKSVAIGTNLGRVAARSPVEFEVEARNAADRPSKNGGDSIKVKFSAPGNLTAATITELPEGRYKIEYVAPNAGTYQMSVTINGEHIDGSPFKVVVTPPRAVAENCTLSGKGLTRMTAGENGIFTVGFFDITGQQGPPEELDIRVKPEGAADLPRDENGDLVVPDKVQKTFNSFDEDGSGDIDFSELRAALAQMGMDGDRKATAVLLRRYDSDGGGLSIQEFTMLIADIEMAHKTGYLLKGVTPAAEKGHREVNYTVRIAGEYEMAICFSAAAGGGVLPGSPYILTVHPAKASPETTQLPEELHRGLKTAVGEQGTILIQAKDQFSNLCNKGGDRLKVTAGSDALIAKLKDYGDGTYEVTYQCDQAGVHRLNITIGNDREHIKGSPLSVACEPGPLHVSKCELLHDGHGQAVTAGSPVTIRVRARDRFGNETANVLSSGVVFVVELRRVHGEFFDVSDAAMVAAGPIGKLDSHEGKWLPGGVFELSFLPASRGHFHVHVLCELSRTLQPDPPAVSSGAPSGAASRAAAPVPAAASRAATPVPGLQANRSGTPNPLRPPPPPPEPPQVERFEVGTFVTFPLEVKPLGPDASTSSIVNASRWQASEAGQLPVGTRLLAVVHLRDKFGNACAWVDSTIDEEEGTGSGDEGSGPGAPASHSRAQALNATLLFHGVGLSDAEARPHAIHVDPRDEEFGVYEARYTLSRSGRRTFMLKLGNTPLSNSPLMLQVGAGMAGGLKSRLMLPASGVNQGWSAGGDGNADPSEPTTGQPFRLTVRSRDASGNMVYSGGSKISVSVVEPPVEPGSEHDHILAPKLEWEVIDADNGNYFVDLTTVRPGAHSVTVKMDGEEVIGSPLALNAVAPKVMAVSMSVGKSRGETLFVCASAIANAAIKWALGEWVEMWLERREKLDILQGAARRLMHADVIWMLQVWYENATWRKEVRQKLKRAMGALRKGKVFRALSSWMSYSFTRKSRMELLMRCASALQNVNLHKAFETWLQNLYGSDHRIIGSPESDADTEGSEGGFAKLA